MRTLGEVGEERGREKKQERGGVREGVLPQGRRVEPSLKTPRLACAASQETRRSVSRDNALCQKPEELKGSSEVYFSASLF